MNKRPRSILRIDRLAIPFLSAGVGWMAALVLFAIHDVVTMAIVPSYEVFGSEHFSWTDVIGAILAVGFFMGISVMFVALIVLLPLNLLIPSESRVWKPWILTASGIFGGPFLANGTLLFNGRSLSDLMDSTALFLWVLVPATIGGVTCYTAALLNQRLLRKAA